MSQVSNVLRRLESGYAHWCPGCEEMHKLPDGWFFDGNLEKPTFKPSFKHEGVRSIYVNGVWTGEWVKDTNGKAIPFVCHYILTAGVLNFCADCSHTLRMTSVPLPALPDGLRDR